MVIVSLMCRDDGDLDERRAVIVVARSAKVVSKEPYTLSSNVGSSGQAVSEIYSLVCLCM